jgi:DNA repair protein RadC
MSKDHRQDHKRISEWSKDDRPREKLETHGPEVLSDAELLAILLGSGIRNVTAVDLAKQLIWKFGGLSEVAQRNFQELRKLKGIGKVKAIKIVAAFEIARRTQAVRSTERAKITGPEQIANRYMPLMRDLKREVFKIVLLDSANQIIKDVVISEGTLNASLVHPREVFKAALDDHAASLILIHNHPSGNPEPSTEDITITQQLREAGKVMGVPVRDHIILAGHKYTSLAQMGYL